jgi:cell division protein FtsW
MTVITHRADSTDRPVATRAVDTITRNTDYLLMAVVGGLVGLGLVMVYSASFVEAFMQHENQFYYLIRQMIGAVIGTVGLLVAWRLDYRIWRRFSVYLMGITLLLLVAVLLLPESMTMVNGSRSWIRFQGGLFSMQPSEVAKLAIIVYFADWLSRRGDTVSRVENVTYGLLPFGLMSGLVFGLVLLEPDKGTAVVLLVISCLIYFAAGANLWHVLGAGLMISGVLWTFVRFLGENNMRIRAFFDPWEYYSTFGYQPLHALYALGSGGIFGVGLGQARQKFQWLPQAHTDSIFAIVGEELGLIGTLLVLLAFTLIAHRGYRIACRTPDRFAALVAVGITSWLVFQAFLNIAVTTSLVPFTGLTLPFLSYGSTSLIMCMVSVGILLNISSQTVAIPPAEEQPDVSISNRSPALEYFRTTRQRVATLPMWGWYRRSRLPGTGGRRYSFRSFRQRSRTTSNTRRSPDGKR